MVLTTGSVLVTLLSIAFIFVCLLLILLILIQRPKGGGLAGAFGGAGGSDQAMFGAKAGDALTWITVGLFVGFLLLAMGLTWTTVPNSDEVPPVKQVTMPIDTEDEAAKTDDAAAAATDTVNDAAATATDAVKDAAEKTTQAVKDAADKAAEVTSETIDKAVEVTKEAVDAVKTEVKEATTPAEPEAK